MFKATLTLEFDKLADLREATARLAGAANDAKVILTQPQPNPRDAEIATMAEITEAFNANREETEKRARKPRADRGQKREPYGPRTTTTGEPAAPSVTAEQAGAAATASAAPATPTTSSAPQEPKSAAEGQHEPPAAAAEESEFPATLDGARAAMAALNATAGKGMDACIGTLKVFGVNRISDLPAEKYGHFINDVLSQSSPEGLTAGRAKLAEQAKGKK